MKTVSVALVMCLHIGVDPPDVVKTSPCAKLECWIGKIETARGGEENLVLAYRSTFNDAQTSIRDDRSRTPKAVRAVAIESEIQVES